MKTKNIYYIFKIIKPLLLVGCDCGDFWAHPSIPTILMKSSGELKIGQYECLTL